MPSAPATRADHWPVACTPWATARSSSTSSTVRPSAASDGHGLGEQHGGGDAVLVAHQVADAEAERLLVAEAPGWPSGPAARLIHLKPVSVST